MGSNSFGNLFRITTWGESHGPAIGVVIDGCPAGLEISEQEIQQELDKRKPGTNPHTSPRKESDTAQILSGTFEGRTTGTPISILIKNHDADPSKYEPFKDLYRPGHANFTYLEKYGIFDHRGGGRSSARETACRVAAGAIAKKLLALHKIQLHTTIKEIGGYSQPDEIHEALEEAKASGDSLGGIIEFVATNLPVGLGDPIYEKLEANLAKAMLSINACKGIEFGSGFASARMKGSENNDLFTTDDQGNVITQTNHAGGLLGGISNGMPLILRTVFKPTSSIAQPQMTLSTKKEPREFTLPEGSRHDPCVALRALPVVEAMGAITLADALLKRASMQLPWQCYDQRSAPDTQESHHRPKECAPNERARSSAQVPTS